jgi:hypothetical protein
MTTLTEHRTYLKRGFHGARVMHSVFYDFEIEMGANVPSKVLEQLHYVGTTLQYATEISDRAQDGYKAFTFS